ncbi:hypothetical protein [Ralstonia sp. 24A2]|uniref:hypothetical protein n=1 Tax=Ralstonia sp. 24A2 TaxID=3447364 RepID=UPI003F69EFF3
MIIRRLVRNQACDGGQRQAADEIKRDLDRNPAEPPLIMRDTVYTLSAIGVFGLHTVFVQQYQSDSNNPWGTIRYRTVNAGGFFTTKVPGIDAAVTIQYMRTVASHNAKAGDLTQIRIIKVF